MLSLGNETPLNPGGVDLQEADGITHQIYLKNYMGLYSVPLCSYVCFIFAYVK